MGRGSVGLDCLLTEHLADWQGVLATRGNTSDYVSLKVIRARRVIDVADFLVIRNLSASEAEAGTVEVRKHLRFRMEAANRWMLDIAAVTTGLAAGGRETAGPDRL